LAEGPVVIEGYVEVFDPDTLIGDPLTGDLCVFAHYEAYMPGYAQRLMITGGGGPMNLVARSAQGSDFLVRDASGVALIRPSAGADLLALHHEMLSRHGFEMKAHTQLIKAGDRVRVRGQVVKMMEGSPMRREDFAAVIEAENVEALGG
jgi:hypothetical protein